MLAVALAPAGVRGEEIVHRLTEGETVADVAQEYWGEPDWADLLRTHNHLPDGPPSAGLELRVPIAVEHTVQSGDTWTSLAKAMLDDAALATLLAEMNGADPEKPLLRGSQIKAPAIATYRLGKGETLAAVARRFLSGTAEWKTLARLNHLGNPHSLRAGTELRVPVHPRTVADSGPAEKKPPPPVAAPPPETEAAPMVETTRRSAADTSPLEEPIRDAVNAFLDGRYEEARERLERLRSEAETSGSREQQVMVLEYLTLVYVAFDSSTEACEAYRALRAVEPQQRWDPDRISPKVVRMTSLCRAR
jgi:LysM repeat protein